jgi:two-component system chemotaxis response regulator CheB
MGERRFEAVVAGCSAGGLEALRALLGPLPADFPLPILVVAHTAPDGDGRLLAGLLARACRLPVTEVVDKQPIRPGRVCLAPADYHLLVEPDRSLALSLDPKVCNVRPSIDVLFESAADVYGRRLIGVILTGANRDGSRGLQVLHAAGGVGLVQDPSTALAAAMPRAAIEAGGADHVAALDAMAGLLVALTEGEDVH